jgi:excisionase family DNA binding protein
MSGDLITVREAANYLRISARTVYRLIESGQIGAVRIGKQWRIPAADLPGRDQSLVEQPQAVERTASA